MEVKLGAGEKLILLLLCDICDHLKIKGESHTELIKEAIFSGNLWGLDWGLPGVFHDYETPTEVVKESVDVLSMWTRLEESFEHLSDQDKSWLEKQAEPFGKQVRFPGFDGNNESTYISAARFMIDHLDRFQRFKGREMNAHMPTIGFHRRMLAVFDPILKRVLNKDFSAAEISQVLNAQRHPES